MSDPQAFFFFGAAFFAAFFTVFLAAFFAVVFAAGVVGFAGQSLGLGVPLLCHLEPPAIQVARALSKVMPLSSSSTPNWNPQEGQISYDPPPERERGASLSLG